MNAQRKLGAWVVAGMALSLLPLLLLGFSVRLHDGRIHQLWIEGLFETLDRGGGYPRWLVGVNEGLGSPAMFFYPALPYLGGLPFVTVLGSARALAVGVVVATGVACWGMQRLLNAFVQPSTAFAGAVLYVTAPYYLGTDLYTRGAYAEYWAFAWMPLVLLGVMKVHRGCGVRPFFKSGKAVDSFPVTPALSLGKREAGERSQNPSLDRNGETPVAKAGDEAARASPYQVWAGVLLLAFGYGALVATHLPTTLVFSLVPLVLSGVPVRGWHWQPLAFTVLGMTLGIGLAAPYLMPAMTMQEHVSMAELTSFHKYNHNFFFWELGWGGDLGQEFKQTLYLPFLATAGMGVMGFLLARSGQRACLTRRRAVPATPEAVPAFALDGQPEVSGVTPNKAHEMRASPGQSEVTEQQRLAKFFLAVVGAGVFMMVPLSDFVWQLFPKLQVIQFPWRICSVLTVAAAVLVALGLDGLRHPLTLPAVVQLYFLIIAFASGLAYTGEAIWKFVGTVPRLERAVTIKGYNLDVAEYRPRWAQQNLQTTVQFVHRAPTEVEHDRDSTSGVAWINLGAHSANPMIGAQTVDGGAKLAVMEWRSRELRLACDNEQPVTLHVSQLYFPGWAARRDGQLLPLRPSDPAGLIEIDVSAGKGDIEIILEPLGQEIIGNRVGLTSAGVWLAGIVWLQWRRKSERDQFLTTAPD